MFFTEGGAMLIAPPQLRNLRYAYEMKVGLYILIVLAPFPIA